MKKLIISVFASVLFLGLSAQAAESHVEEFYWGTQKTLTGSTQCLVKIENRTDSEVEASAVAYLLHDQTYININEQTLIFDAKNNAYIFNSQETTPLVKQIVLFLNQTAEPVRFAASVLHGSHFDPIFCENLKLAQGAEITKAEDFIAQYAGAETEHDHDHSTHEEDHADADHDHDHDHDHGDHDHAH